MKNKILFVLSMSFLTALSANAQTAAGPTYTANIQPLFQKYCVACHDAGSDYGNLMDYNEAFGYRKKIAALVDGGRMPKGHSAITDDERDLIVEWANGGAAQ